MHLRVVYFVLAANGLAQGCADTSPSKIRSIENCQNGQDDDDDGAIDCADSECTFKPACANSCGNGRLDAGEACDGIEVGGASCQDLGFASGTLGCNASCTAFDMALCTGTVLTCGNGQRDGAELCDASDLGGESCESQGFASGVLACKSSCLAFDTRACQTASQCGNGLVDSNEDCDGNDLNGQDCTSLGYDGGVLGCINCALVTTGCANLACNDNILTPPEVCDGDLLNAQSCVGLGFLGGILTCDECALDVSSCFGCGDGVVNAYEACDGNAFSFSDTSCSGVLGNPLATGNVVCSSACKLDLSSCVVDAQSYSDHCAAQGYYSDGFCDPCEVWGGTRDEDCDMCGHDSTCSDYFSVWAGAYACEIVTGARDLDCVPTCGDGVMDFNVSEYLDYRDPGEFCDGTDFTDASGSSVGCDFFGLTGTIGCTADCVADLTQCQQPQCGNDVIEGYEECDGNDFATGFSSDCADHNLGAGLVQCTADCGADFSGCSLSFNAECGDGVAQGFETCDVNDWGAWGGPLCSNFGLGTGTLLCGDDCTYFTVDTSGCSVAAGICEANDWFDDGICDLCFYYDGEEDVDCLTLCGADGMCADWFDVSLQMWTCITPDPDCQALCGDGFVDPLEGELCDHNNTDPDNLLGQDCTHFGFSGGTLSCAQDCTFNFEACER